MSDETPWVSATMPGQPKNNILELIVPALLNFDEETRKRWIDCLNVNMFGIRVLDPDPELDVNDPLIPDDRFTLFLHGDGLRAGGLASVDRASGDLSRSVLLSSEPTHT